MKGLVEYIEEASNEFISHIRNLKFTEEEPKSEQDKYVAINGYGKTWKDECGPYYVKIKDLGKYTDQAGLMSVAYNFIKDRDSKMTAAEVCAWDKNENKYMSFCYATLQKKNRSWHPEWVDWKVNENLNESQKSVFADEVKFSKEDFEKWSKEANDLYIFAEQDNLILIYKKLEKPIEKILCRIDVEHIATYNFKTQKLFTDDTTLFGN